MHQQPKNFNDAKHAHGNWNTKIVATDNSFIRTCIGYVSAKRRGVSDLASCTQNNSFVLDAGAGNCAYSVWFASNNFSKVISIDISHIALKSFSRFPNRNLLKGNILRVCGDISALPFKENLFSTVFTIDTLGHINDVNMVLDEINRCTKKGAVLFCHSECADYKNKWPDNMLIHKLFADIPSSIDGHTGSYYAKDLFQMYSRRFRILSFTNPRGFLGWILGYPEKYVPAFTLANIHVLATILRCMAKAKQIPVLGIFIRFCNAFTNHCEVFFGLTGGGSCFARLKKDD